MKLIALAATVLAGSLAVPVSATERYVPLGDLNCIAAPGTGANAMVCEFRSVKDGTAEVYIALAEQPVASKPAAMTWNVASSGETAYRKGGLEGDYVAQNEDGILIGASNTGLILQLVQGAGGSSPTVVRLQAAK